MAFVLHRESTRASKRHAFLMPGVEITAAEVAPRRVRSRWALKSSPPKLRRAPPRPFTPGVEITAACVEITAAEDAPSRPLTAGVES